jgi:hypothetical protein
MYLMRVVRGAGSGVRSVFSARTPTHARLRDQIVAVALITLGVDLLCALLALWFEHHAPQTQIHTFGSAIFWTSTQLLTVSSSIQNPVSAPGRVLDVLMEIYAITVVASLAGSLGAFLVKRGREIEAEEQHAAHPRAR